MFATGDLQRTERARKLLTKGLLYINDTSTIYQTLSKKILLIAMLKTPSQCVVGVCGVAATDFFSKRDRARGDPNQAQNALSNPILLDNIGSIEEGISQKRNENKRSIEHTHTEQAK